MQQYSMGQRMNMTSEEYQKGLTERVGLRVVGKAWGTVAPPLSLISHLWGR